MISYIGKLVYKYVVLGLAHRLHKPQVYPQLERHSFPHDCQLLLRPHVRMSQVGDVRSYQEYQIWQYIIIARTSSSPLIEL